MRNSYHWNQSKAWEPLYFSNFDCFDSAVPGLAMETTMMATFYQHTGENAFMAYPNIRGAVIHSGYGTQCTSELYHTTLRKYDIIQSMNSAGGRCHDDARCESMWARIKTELLHDRYDSEKLTVSELKSLIWIYLISYWRLIVKYTVEQHFIILYNKSATFTVLISQSF